MLSKETILELMKNDPPLIENEIDVNIQIQVNGFDLTIKNVKEFLIVKSIEEFYIECGILDFDNTNRRLPKTKEIHPKVTSISKKDSKYNSFFWNLDKGAYLIEFNEKVNLPKNISAMTLPRSSLLRIGANMNSAMWDAGYSGTGQMLLIIYNPIKLYANARICQMVFFKVDKETGGYNGIYQKENWMDLMNRKY